MKKSLSESKTIVLLFALLFLLSILGCQQYSAKSTRQEWNSFVNEFIESYFVANPDKAVWAGRHEFDGKLPDWSAEGLKRQVEQLKAQRKQAIAFAPATLSESQRFERNYLIAVIDGELFWLDKAEWPYKNPRFYLRLEPSVYIAREYAPLAERMRAYTEYAEKIPTAVKQIRNNLRTPLPRTYIEVGQKLFGGLAFHYENDVPAVFADVEDAQLQARFRKANTTAINAMKGLTDWLKAQMPNATEDFALGKKLFLEMLWDTERVKVPLEQFKAIGERDLQRNLDALKKACEKYAPGKPIAQYIAEVRANKPKDGPLERARHQLKELKTFLIEKDIVTIPVSEEAEVTESPPYRRWNPANLNAVGPYEKGLPSFYYITNPDPSWSEDERLAYTPSEGLLMLFSLHEVWPGHFLQILHSNRSSSGIAQIFISYGFSEGWAHYTEEMMLEAGFENENQELHINQLVASLFRNVRFLSAIGLHTEGMTFQESERMFREFAYQDPGNARQQAARGTFEPKYLYYTMGKLMLRKLREDWTASRGGRKAWKEFHNEFLSYGGPPIPLIREAMLGRDSGPLF